MNELSVVAFGALLGGSLAIPPGPMNALIAARSTRSWRAGTLTGLGALSADAVLGTLVFALASEIDLTAYIAYIYLLGAAVMVVLAILLLREPASASSSEPGGLATYSRALAIGLSNPFQIIWWLTAGVAFAYVGGAWLFAGLFGAISVWVVTFPWLVHSGSQRYPLARRWIVVGSAGLFLAFAAYFALLVAVRLV
jgi:threonine/homoserine/homoserine lactone efflux protein